MSEDDDLDAIGEEEEDGEDGEGEDEGEDVSDLEVGLVQAESDDPAAGPFHPRRFAAAAGPRASQPPDVVEPVDEDMRRRMEGERLVKSGYLMKKGERRKTWKKRWFVLRTEKLAYYKDDKVSGPNDWVLV